MTAYTALAKHRAAKMYCTADVCSCTAVQPDNDARQWRHEDVGLGSVAVDSIYLFSVMN